MEDVTAPAVEGPYLLEGNVCDKFLGLVLLREHDRESVPGAGESGKSVETSLEGTGKVIRDLGHPMYITIAIERLQPPNS